MTKKILLADDSITIRKVVGIIFATEDYQLLMTDNGDDALKMVQDEAPDLVIADISMPGKDGFELCREIKSTAASATISVMLLPGAFDHFDEAKAEEVYADGWLTKPFESQALLDKVAQLLAAEPKLMPGVAGAPLAEDQSSDEVVVDDYALGLDAVEDLPEAEAEEIADSADDLWDSVSFADDELEDAGVSDSAEEPLAASEADLDLSSEIAAEEDSFGKHGADVDPFVADGAPVQATPPVAAVAPVAEETLAADTAEDEFSAFDEDDLPLDDAGNIDFGTPESDLPDLSADQNDAVESAEEVDFSQYSDHDGFVPTAESDDDFVPETVDEEVFESDPLELLEEDAEPLEEEVGDFFAAAVEPSAEMENVELEPEAEPEDAPVDFAVDEMVSTPAADPAPEVAVAVEEEVEPEPEPAEEILDLSEDEILDLSEDEILEDEAGSAFVSVESEAFAPEETTIAEDEETFTFDSEPAVADEPFSAQEEVYNLDSEAEETEVEVAEADSFYLDEADPEPAVASPLSTAEVEAELPVVETQPVAPVAQLEQQLRDLPEEELKEIVSRVAAPIIEKLAGELLEQIAWEVVPDLAEVMIREEIRKIKQDTAE